MAAARPRRVIGRSSSELLADPSLDNDLLPDVDSDEDPGFVPPEFDSDDEISTADEDEEEPQPSTSIPSSPSNLPSTPSPRSTPSRRSTRAQHPKSKNRSNPSRSTAEDLIMSDGISSDNPPTPSRPTIKHKKKATSISAKAGKIAKPKTSRKPSKPRKIKSVDTNSDLLIISDSNNTNASDVSSKSRPVRKSAKVAALTWGDGGVVNEHGEDEDEEDESEDEDFVPTNAVEGEEEVWSDDGMEVD
ncbi:hypothetical protein HK097_001784 [Rhizophlyctis rosea]|uniref:Uncharacterized protein n=1 Tax=Rhizophlyctis rosea TaxID=64517 RepID=A0AAD5X140_9FUNG|nr:hypothetical protein HK097_001784 [Rhizophlyctis rosea]